VLKKNIKYSILITP